ncbi:MAG: MCE family protein [Candidatus Omnitrophica bacterium]|nr:MCE family protein [Candidatus Omnitrophota bacterium]
MTKKANRTVIGVFVVGAVALFITGLIVFGSGVIFNQADEYVLFFDGSIKGLSVGAPVIFRGVRIGSVKGISLVYDHKVKDLVIPVVIEIIPGRVKGAPKKWGHSSYELLIKEGLRAKLEVQSFITGQLMISFDFYPDTIANLRGIMKNYHELPTLPTTPDIFGAMEDVPIKEIAQNLDITVKGINSLLDSGYLQETFYELKGALQEITQSARSFRMLVDYLEQHPEAFLKGKPIIKGE